jgi:hypothetical protein
VLFYYVFALPIVMIIQFFRARAAAKSRQPSTGQPFNYAPGQPYNQTAGQGYGYAYNQPPQAYNQGFGQAPAGYPPPTTSWAARPETMNAASYRADLSPRGGSEHGLAPTVAGVP